MDRWQNQETQLTSPSRDAVERVEERVPALTLLAHTDPHRVGERLALPALAAGHEVLLSRGDPVFRAPRGEETIPVPGRTRPLDDRSISRTPIRLVPGDEPGSILLDLSTSRTAVVADGVPVTELRSFSTAEVDRGVVLKVGRRVALLLHRMLLHPPGSPGLAESGDLGLVGENDAIAQIRQEVRGLADLGVAVLLRGATGTGKELVARALHQAGQRRARPFVAVNMATLSPSLAASELFGAIRGAYTGADRTREGFFRHAEGGTLFLDEIGETPTEVQPMLLRTLESYEVVPVGGVEPRKVDVRVVAATDAPLGDAVTGGRFRAPLLHRLAGYTLHLPSLAERRDDIGRLLFFFLAQELEKLGRPALEHDPEHPWPSAEVVARLARYDWPGNVRQLRNVARWLAITGRDLAPSTLATRLERVLAEADGLAGSPSPPAPLADRSSSATNTESHVAKRRRLRKAEEIDDQELRDTLTTHRYEVTATAEALGISRANLYRLIDEHPAIRKATELGRDEVEAALKRCGGDPRAAAVELEVSLRGLKRRITALGLERP